MISPRYAPAIIALFAIAIVPTLIHSYSRDTFDDGRRTSAIPVVLASFRSEPSARNESWGKRRFESDDWMERDYSASAGGRVTLTVVRSFDAKSVYHHPELAVSYHRVSFAGETVQHFPARPDIPVHVLRPSAGTRAIGMYVLHYDDRFISDPLLFQVRLAGELLFSRRQPMTLFFVLDDQAADADNPAASSAAAVMFAAIDAFVGQKSGN
jgi:hypothetical protein